MGGGGESDQQDARPRIAEAGKGPRPVALSAMATRRVRGHGLTMAHEPRAEPAPGNPPAEGLQLRIAPLTELIDNHAVMVRAAGRT